MLHLDHSHELIGEFGEGLQSRVMDKCYVVEQLLVVIYEKFDVAENFRYDVGPIDPQTWVPIKGTSRFSVKSLKVRQSHGFDPSLRNLSTKSSLASHV